MKDNQPTSASVLAIESRLAANQRRRHDFPRDQAGVVRLVKLLHKLFNDKANALLREYGLTHPEYNVLIIIDSSEHGLGPSELAEATSEKAANITRLVDQLIDKGLVVRVADAEDRRRLSVCLTPAGEELIVRVLPAISMQLQGFLAELDESECGQLQQLLSKVIGSVEGKTL